MTGCVRLWGRVPSPFPETPDSSFSNHGLALAACGPEMPRYFWHPQSQSRINSPPCPCPCFADYCFPLITPPPPLLSLSLHVPPTLPGHSCSLCAHQRDSAHTRAPAPALLRALSLSLHRIRLSCLAVVPTGPSVAGQQRHAPLAFSHARSASLGYFYKYGRKTCKGGGGL